MSKFLYTILKQLDLKSIDWQEVADQLDITNGHAARMRFSRFKQQMEGVQSTPRKAKPTAPRQKKAKNKPAPSENRPNEEQHPMRDGQPKCEADVKIKDEPGERVEPMEGIEAMVEPEMVVKEEPMGEERRVSSELLAPKQDILVKSEPVWEH